METEENNFRLVVTEHGTDCSGQMGCYGGCGCYTKIVVMLYSLDPEKLKRKIKDYDQMKTVTKYYTCRLEKLVLKPVYEEYKL